MIIVYIKSNIISLFSLHITEYYGFLFVRHYKVLRPKNKSMKRVASKMAALYFSFITVADPSLILRFTKENRMSTTKRNERRIAVSNKKLGN